MAGKTARTARRVKSKTDAKQAPKKFTFGKTPESTGTVRSSSLLYTMLRGSRLQKRKLSSIIVAPREASAAANETNRAVSETSPPASASQEQQPAKKRRTSAVMSPDGQGSELETSKPSASFKPRKGREWTVSLAVPGSILAK